MKRFLSATIVLLLFCVSAYGQETFATKFGTVSKTDFALKQNPEYKNAPAVVMDDLGKSRFFMDEKGTTIIFRRRTKIKVFTDAGKSYATVKIPFIISDRVKEWVYDVEAITFNHEGGQIVKTKLKPKNVLLKKLSNTRYITEFTLPNVKKGSVIEYMYALKTNSPYRLLAWNFQWKIPVIYSDYNIHMPSFFRYTWELQGSKKLDFKKIYVDKSVTKTYKGQGYYDYVYDLAMTDVPAFQQKNFMPTANDYLMRVSFQLSKIFYPGGGSEDIITSWPKLISKLLKENDFGKYLKEGTKFSSKLMNLKALRQQPEEKRFNTILDFMKSKFKWNADLNILASQKAKKVISEKTGNSADINLLTLVMLRQAGIDAYPVILSTRSHGRVDRNYPYLPFFNDVAILAKINGKQVLADATSPDCLNNMVPIRSINGEALIVRNGKVDWVRLNKGTLSQTITKNDISFQKGNQKVAVGKTATKYDALKFSNKNYNADTLKKELASRNYKVIGSTVSVQNQNVNHKSFKLNYSFTIQPEIVNNKMFVSPFYSEILKNNRFTQSERTIPVDMIYPDKKEFTTTITIPSGYKPDSLPKPLMIDNPLFQLEYHVLQNGNNVTATLMYYFKRAIYPASEYLKLKSFFAQIVQKGNEKIVLSKIKPGN